MRNILDYIEKIKSENEGPRITVQEPRNMNQASLADDLEPGPLKDEMLKGFDPSQETHEEYLQRINLERPFNMNQGGRIGFARGSPGADMQEILNAYKEYKRSHHRGKRRSPIIPFKKYFEIYAPENMAEGGRAGYNDGQLVTPNVDGSRPGYSGVYKRQDKPGRAVKWRVQGERGGVNVGKWLKSQGIATTYTNKKAAEKAYKKFLDANPETKGEITKAKWMTEGEALAKKYNAIVETAFKAGDMSKTPAWETFLKTQDLKHAGINHYKSNRVNVGAVNISPMKRQLVDSLIEDANKKLKHTDWMDIQKKVSPMTEIHTTQWREYIDKLDSRTKKVNKAFDHLLKNDVALKIPKDLGKTMTKHGSLLRKVISDITGVNSNKIIKNGLNSNKNYINKIKQIEFANQGNLWTEGEGRTLKEILNDADYRMDGNISWSSDIKKLAGRPNKNAFDYALRNFNYYGKRGQVGQIQFYYKGDTEMKNPIQWDEIEWDNKGGKKLKPSKVFFVDSTEKKPIKTQWTIEKIDADHANWEFNKKNPSLPKKPTVGLFDELYQAKDVYDNLLNTPVTDPRNPKGEKVKFGKIMKDVYGEGYDNFGNPYAIEHGDTVAKSPWKNLRISEQRINSALYNITRKKGISESVRKQIINQLSKQTYNVFDKDVITKIISGQKPVIESVLGEGKKYNQSILNEILTPEGRLKFRQIGTAKVLNKILENNNIKICNDELSEGKGVVCGTKFAERDPNGFMEAIKRNKDAAKIINKPGLVKNALKGVSAWAKKELGPMGWIGSLATIDSAFGLHALGQGKTPLQALDTTLWFLPKSVLKADEKMFKDVYERAGYTKEDFGEFQKWRELEDLDRQYFSAKKQTDFMQKQVLMPDDKTVLEKGLQKEVDALPDMYKDMGWNRPLFAITSEEEKTGEHPFYGPAVDRYNKIIDRSEKVYKSLKDPEKSWKDLDYTRKLVAMEQANRKKKLMRESLKYAPHLIPLFDPFSKLGPKEMKDQSFLYDEYIHPLYGPSVSPEQIAAVDEGRFKAQLYSAGGRAGYMGGGIAGIRRPHAIPPERQGLRSIMINANDD